MSVIWNAAGCAVRLQLFAYASVVLLSRKKKRSVTRMERISEVNVYQILFLNARKMSVVIQEVHTSRVIQRRDSGNSYSAFGHSDFATANTPFQDFLRESYQGFCEKDRQPAKTTPGMYNILF